MLTSPLTLRLPSPRLQCWRGLLLRRTFTSSGWRACSSIWNSLTIQMEGTRQLLEAAAAVETALDRQHMLKVAWCPS